MNNIINIKESANRLELMDYHASIVCGNSNYILKFSFGDQWQKCNHKVAIFVINGNNLAVDFEGDECVVPVLPNASCMFISLISGEGEKQLATTQIKIMLEPTIAGDDLSEFNVYTSTLSKLVGAVNKIESGDIVANTAKNAVAAQNVSNPNILINGDFRINQRDKKTYTEHNKYTVDRWNLNYGSLTVNDDGSITHTASNSWQGIRQYIEFPSRLAGKTVTFSMKSNSSGIRLVQLSYLKKGNTVTDKIASKQENDISAEILTFSAKIPTDITDEDKLFILLYTPQANQSITYYWTKLEVGSTPTEFVPRLYGEELALCKRYYQVINAREISGNVAGSNSGTTALAYVAIKYDVEMRIVGTRTQPNIFTISCQTPTGTSTYTQSKTGLYFSYCTTKGGFYGYSNWSELPAGMPFFCTQDVKILELDAEIY